jgi:Cytochrome b5-like Heme/Steroid binding domain
MGTRQFSVEELAKHDGKDTSVPLLICVRGVVFDVSRSREFYGPGLFPRHCASQEMLCLVCGLVKMRFHRAFKPVTCCMRQRSAPENGVRFTSHKQMTIFLLMIFRKRACTAVAFHRELMRGIIAIRRHRPESTLQAGHMRFSPGKSALGRWH